MSNRTLCVTILAAVMLPTMAEAAETNACIALVERKGVVTASLQSAIDATSASGGGIVRLPRGRFLTDGIRLKDNVTLDIPAGCVLVASTNLSAYAEQTVNYVAPDSSKSCKAFICAENAANVAITGKGAIIGSGCYFAVGCAVRGRPRLLRFIDCRNVRLEGVSLLAPATWSCHFMRCDGVVVSGVKIESHANYNNDGLDIEARNVLVEDCDIDVEDDAVCFKSDTPDFVVENCEVRNCRISSNSNFIKFGTTSAGTYRKIDVHDCEVSCKTPSGFTDWRYWEWRPGAGGGGIPGVRTAKCGLAGIALEVVDGGVMEDVSVRNIEIGAGVQTPILIRHGRRHESAVKGRPSVMRNILIENVRAVAPAESLIACSITGVPGLRPHNIVLRNVDLLFPGDVEPPFPGGREVSEKFDSVPEVEGSYPENRMFGTILPAWGIYVRHVDGIAFENVHLKLANPDRREHAVVAVDVSGLSVNGCNFTPHVQASDVVEKGVK